MTNEGIYINYKHQFRPNSNAITSTKNTSSQAFRSKVVSSICKARNSMQALSRPDSQSYLIKKNFCQPSHLRKIVTSEAPLRNFSVTRIL